MNATPDDSENSDRRNSPTADEVSERSIAASGAALTAGQTSKQPRADEATLHQECSQSAGGDVASDAPPNAAGARRYRILQLHARGGLGVVYLAEDTELRRRIAIKEIQDRFAHDPRCRQRFIQEAEVTARLAHPGIVPVHGLGRHADGRPFYAMRFVEGETLLDAIQGYHASTNHGVPAEQNRSRRRLALRQLLAHFVSLCNTVAYAHSQGVIHRDLKPSNVLLGRFGETLLVDWGLAKYVGVCQTESTALSDEPPSSTASERIHSATVQGATIGTPAYMSPEQAAGRWSDVGIPSDIFSLGATLYVLLAGIPPARDGPTDAHWLPPPLAAIPSPRSFVPDTPAALEAICRKAMQPTAAERYSGALELAADVEHWLGDEAVSALPDSLAIRAGRWARRHLAVVSGVAAGLAALGLSLAIGLGLLARANRQISDANAQLLDANARMQRAERQTLQAVDELFTDVSENPRLLRKEPGTHALRRALLERARDYYERFLRERGDDVELQGETAAACFRLAVIEEELAPGPKSLDLYRRAESIRARLAAAGNSPDRQFDLATTRNHIGKVLQDLGRSAEAAEAFDQAQSSLATLVAAHPNRIRYARELARVQMNIGVTKHLASQSGPAMESCAAARTLLERLTKEQPGDLEIAQELAVVLSNLGALQQLSGSAPAAVETLTAARAILERLMRAAPDRTDFAQFFARSCNELAVALIRTQQATDALTVYEDARAVRERLARDNPAVADFARDLAVTYTDVGTLYRMLGRGADAADSCRKAKAIQEKLVADHPSIVEYQRDLARTHNNLGVILEDEYLRDGAVAAFTASRAIKERLVRDQPTAADLVSELAKTCHNLGRSLAKLGRRDEARTALQQARDLRRQLESRSPPGSNLNLELLETELALAELDRDSGRLDDAWARYTEALRIADALPSAAAVRPRRDVLRSRALALSRAGRHDAALADCEQAIALADDAAIPLIRLERAAARLRSGNPVGLQAAREALAPADAHPAVIAESARVLALSADPADTAAALAALQRAAAAGWFADPARVAALSEDPDFIRVRDLADFKAWAAALKTRR
mgnify:CR=1 FL=1